MKKRMGWLLVFFALVVSTCLAADPAPRPPSWATPVSADAMKNFYKVDDRLYRGAQPDAAGMKAIEQLGIRNVLNLREFHTDTQEAEQTRLTLFHVPMNAGRIKDEDVVAALKVIQKAQGPTLVHCWHGSDRTGLIVAMYRMIFQGWQKQAAIDELVNGGYGYHSVYANIVTYIEKVDLESTRKQIASAAEQKR
ncbi:MAG: dual specificity protein phosphatase family protein [Desulfatitalea sp.]